MSASEMYRNSSCVHVHVHVHRTSRMLCSREPDCKCKGSNKQKFKCLRRVDIQRAARAGASDACAEEPEVELRQSTENSETLESESCRARSRRSAASSVNSASTSSSSGGADSGSWGGTAACTGPLCLRCGSLWCAVAGGAVRGGSGGGAKLCGGGTWYGEGGGARAVAVPVSAGG